MDPVTLTAGAVVAQSIAAGVSLLGTTPEQISQAINSDRNITIQITNFSTKYTLGHPRVYTYSGYCHKPPQPTINKKTQEVCSFSKTRGTACGSVGVLTYQIYTSENKSIGQMAIMFSVPYNYNIYENIFSMGVFGPEIQCDDSLYQKMYYDDVINVPFVRAKGIGNCIDFRTDSVHLEGTMSPQAQSMIKLEFKDK